MQSSFQKTSNGRCEDSKENSSGKKCVTLEGNDEHHRQRDNLRAIINSHVYELCVLAKRVFEEQRNSEINRFQNKHTKHRIALRRHKHVTSVWNKLVTKCYNEIICRVKSLGGHVLHIIFRNKLLAIGFFHLRDIYYILCVLSMYIYYLCVCFLSLF